MKTKIFAVFALLQLFCNSLYSQQSLGLQDNTTGAFFNFTSNPITGTPSLNGNIGIGFDATLGINRFLATPSSSPDASPIFRLIEAIDLPVAGSSQAGIISTSTGTTQILGAGKKEFPDYVFFQNGNFAAGVATPSIAFKNSTGTGFYYTISGMTSEERIHLSIGSVEVLHMSDDGSLSVSNNGDFTNQLDLNISHDSNLNHVQDGGIGVTTYGGTGCSGLGCHTSTFTGRTASGSQGSPTQTKLNQAMAEFTGKGYFEAIDPDDDAFEESNRGVFGVYAAIDQIEDNQAAYCAIQTTKFLETNDHFSFLIDATGNAGLVFSNSPTAPSFHTVLPLEWNPGTYQSRFFSIESELSTLDAGLLIQNGSSSGGTKGINIWLDNSANTTFLDNILNDDAGLMIVRLKTLGTPINAITTAITGSTFKGWLVASALDAGLATTSTDGLVAVNSKASTVGVPVQYSPRLRLSGTAWNTTLSTSQITDYICEIRPISGTSISSGYFLSSQINVGGYTDILSFTDAGRMAVKAGTSSGLTVKVGGTIDVGTTTAGNAAATETSLYSKSIAANMLSANSDRISFNASGTFKNTSRIKLKFGGTVIFDSGNLAITGTKSWSVSGVIVRTSSTTQKCTVEFISSDASLRSSANYTTSAETLTGAVTLDVRGAGSNANDVIFEMGSIEWKPSN